LFQKALWFAQFIVVYNVIEGIVSMVLGYKEESLTLFGFGVDSFIEVASNLGVIFMIKRIQQNPNSDRTKFEKKALKITGYGFYLLSVSLMIGIIINLIQNHKPENTIFGLIISIISIAVMAFVAYNQLDTGKKLDSAPIIADAKCTLICIYMSIVLLLSSAVYYFTGFAYTDILGALGLIYFSIKEGKECFDKVNNNKLCSCEHN
jgi:divalent metal cation (Fe/Co/Zn/Cd) transporter